MGVDGAGYRLLRHFTGCVESTVSIRPAKECECQAFAHAGDTPPPDNLEDATAAANAAAIGERRQ